MQTKFPPGHPAASPDANVRRRYWLEVMDRIFDDGLTKAAAEVAVAAEMAID